MNKQFGLFAIIVGFYYIVQFICAVCACNFYSDISRFNNCVYTDGTLITGNDASAVYDMAIYLLGIFHVIEWIRSTVLLTVVCVGTNLMQIWYLTAISMFYGIAVFVYAHVIYASDDSQACAEAQKTRHDWLMVELIYFWCLFWCFQVPMLLLRFYKKEKLEEILNAETPEESD